MLIRWWRWNIKFGKLKRRFYFLFFIFYWIGPNFPQRKNLVLYVFTVCFMYLFKKTKLLNNRIFNPKLLYLFETSIIREISIKFVILCQTVWLKRYTKRATSVSNKEEEKSHIWISNSVERHWKSLYKYAAYLANYILEPEPIK